MIVKVLNKVTLVGKAQTEALKKARMLVLDSYEAALNAVQPKKLVQSNLTLHDSTLKIGNLFFDLQKFNHIYVVGGGKASGEMAAALEQILGKWITNGVVNVPKGSKTKTNKIVLNEASHPVPDEAGVLGAKQMLQIAKQAGQDDLLICLISGGGSSLMPLPRESVTLGDKQELTKMLLKSGAAIAEVNTVRKHLSAFKGGNLAKEAYPATVLSLIISDVVGDGLGDIASGPTAPDKSTFHDAVDILRKYGIWETAPATVKETILKGVKGENSETPKANDKTFEKVHNVIVGNNQSACTAVKKYFERQGVEVCLLSDPLEGEARQVAMTLAGKIRDQAVASKQVCLIAGGETTVTVRGKGVGGRNQELALAAALQLRGLEGFVFAALSTDGVDGPTDAAGAIIDETTLDRAEQLGLNAEMLLQHNDSYRFFSGLENLVFTGHTGTNVNDLAITLIMKP
ncbi:MAG: glycerate kinase type-2 family protein [Candidatus Bathyarchaeia archaeon]|jgi:glycerate-2-kinase